MATPNCSGNMCFGSLTGGTALPVPLRCRQSTKSPTKPRVYTQDSKCVRGNGSSPLKPAARIYPAPHVVSLPRVGIWSDLFGWTFVSNHFPSFGTVRDADFSSLHDRCRFFRYFNVCIGEQNATTASGGWRVPRPSKSKPHCCQLGC